MTKTHWQVFINRIENIPVDAIDDTLDTFVKSKSDAY